MQIESRPLHPLPQFGATDARPECLFEKGAPTPLGARCVSQATDMDVLLVTRSNCVNIGGLAVAVSCEL
jgi:hypothetical protein